MTESRANSTGATANPDPDPDPDAHSGPSAGPDPGAAAAEAIGSDLHLELTGPGGRRASLMRALREAIRSGRLAPGTRLPPYRSLSADLGIARNTVAEAYAELVAEGWLTARQGSGTRVAPRTAPLKPAPVRGPDAVRGATPAPPTATRSAPPAYSLLQGRPDAASFPRAAWLTSARRALTAAPNEAFGPGDPHGRPELREALAEYLARARGVRTEPDRIVICSGFAHALRLLTQVLRGPMAVEAYGLGFHRGILAAARVRTVPLSVDADGARTGELAASGAKSVLLTPAHQFPTGGPLGPERRAAVVDWARTTAGFVLEDDYDGEFRYDRQPVGAVQGLDPERVVYLGSVSKSLSPAVRLGWMVLPGRLVNEVVAVKGEREGTAGALDQLTLADFIGSGSYDRHVRRMRQRYRRRRDQLVTALAERAPHIGVSGVAAGLHAVLDLPPGTEGAAVRDALRQGLVLDGLAGYRHPGSVMPLQDGLVVGYGTPPDHAFSGALEALCRALPPSRGESGGEPPSGGEGWAVAGSAAERSASARSRPDRSARP
ncbi:PLP-dependent aminotransferase family protein [Streptomyces sp. H10-C2]|uniref:MocR-like pyridoxine biosynthesis transcription factor PdxR n=1 Tax=unclassified Streptomyces TaxID=2593676 RepID=UPI0024BB242F|nr:MULTISPECIES: PLP-dependent aminotransferase family protein [unclassified Streptomyces]MDJ0342070.1 PLP-dependent aminotransferase family protein [Streptomyces sp. PH10-H1]MDJ0368412.1 PLP-dependent aminotransferase family protein [Streptomyces sp. H10-C2]